MIKLITRKKWNMTLWHLEYHPLAYTLLYRIELLINLDFGKEMKRPLLNIPVSSYKHNLRFIYLYRRVPSRLAEEMIDFSGTRWSRLISSRGRLAPIFGWRARVWWQWNRIKEKITGWPMPLHGHSQVFKLHSLALLFNGNL